MEPFGLPDSPQFDLQRFRANSVANGGAWYEWRKPVGKSCCSIFMLGAGGGGGQGAVGANSTAAGGGGGGSAGQTILEIPFWAIPDALFLSVGFGISGAAGIKSYASIYPNITANHVVGIANGGGVGGNASGATAGAAGAAGGIATAATMPFGWAFAKLALAGQAGIIGGVAVAGGNQTLPTTGLRVAGGAGGGGLPAAAAAGTNGGGVNAVAAPTNFPPHNGGVGSATATAPAQDGSNGYPILNNTYFLPGTGGASTHGTATGGGLVQSRGGDGGLGCGGGGNGGALTGSAAAARSKGGDGLIVIVSW